MSYDTALDWFLKKIPQTETLSREKEHSLSEEIRNGDDTALKTLILHNQGLVIKISTRYVRPPVLIEDLISVGNLALHRAAIRFKPVNGTRFSTYAYPIVRGSVILECISQSQSFPLPRHVCSHLYRLQRAAHSLEKDLMDFSDTQELAELTGISCKMVNRLVNLKPVAFSLHSTHGDDQGTAYLEKVPDEQEMAPNREYEETDYHTALRKLMDEIPERSRQIILRNYGLKNGKSESLASIGQSLGLTRERTRQIAFQTLRTLRKKLLMLDNPIIGQAFREQKISA